MAVVCPVCAHTQVSGEACEECGKVLAATAPAPVAVPRMAELEASRFEGHVTVADELPWEELEPTSEVRLPSYEIARTADMEGTALPSAPAPAAAPLSADVDTGRSPSVGARTAAPAGTLLCRYCRQPQPVQALLCQHCGMRLPTLRAASTSAPAQGRSRCHACAAPSVVDGRCTDCGTAVPDA